MKKRIIFLGLFLLLGFGCKQTGERLSGQEESHDHKEEIYEEVHLLEKQMEVMEIRLGKFQELNLSTTVKASGRLELPPQNQANVSAIMGGRVKEIRVLEGDAVRKGQILALVQNPELMDIQEDYLMDKSEFERVQIDYERQEKLHKEGAISTAQFQQTKADFYSAKATFSASIQRLQLLGISSKNVDQGEITSFYRILSPLNGHVTQIRINLGRFVVPQQEMFEVVDNDHIHIDLKVYEKDMERIRKGQKIAFSLSSNPDTVYFGSIFSVGRSLQEESKAMLVHADIDNYSGTLLPGMYVDARIITDQKVARALPISSIVSDGGLDYIFILLPEKLRQGGNKKNEGHEKEYIFRKIEVNTGAEDMGFVEVVPAYNIPDHIEVVTFGTYYLLAEMKKGEVGHGHHH